MDVTNSLIKLSAFLPNFQQWEYVKTTKTDSISLKFWKRFVRS